MKVNKPLDLLGLTQEQFNRFRAACNRTYQVIGGDLADARGGKSAKRAEIVECVLDANFVLMYGEYSPGGKGFQKIDEQPWPVFYKEVIRPLLDKHYFTPKFKLLMKEIFPYNNYE